MKGEKSPQMRENISPPDHLQHTYDYDVQFAPGFLWGDQPQGVEGPAAQKVGQ